MSARELMLVRVECEGGIAGLGEASFLPGEEGRLPELAGEVRTLARAILQTEAGSWPLVQSGNRGEAERAALAGLDVALCDALARASGVRLAELLGPSPQASVAVNALIGGGSLEETVAQAVAARDEGFETVKLKVGMAPSLAGERRTVAAVREAIGPRVRLRLDANGAWDERRAVETIAALEEFEIEFVEQPLAPGNIDSLARVRRRAGVPIAADEDVADAATALRIIESGAADVLVLKPLRLGGVRPAHALARSALEAGLKVTVTTSIDSGVGTAAALHLAASLPEGSPAAGLATASLLKASLTMPRLTVERGRMRVPAVPGLGADVEASEAAMYRTGSWEIGE